MILQGTTFHEMEAVAEAYGFVVTGMDPAPGPARNPRRFQIYFALNRAAVLVANFGLALARPMATPTSRAPSRYGLDVGAYTPCAKTFCWVLTLEHYRGEWVAMWLSAPAPDGAPYAPGRGEAFDRIGQAALTAFRELEAVAEMAR